MDTKEIKTHISQLEKANDDKTILQILTILKKDIKPTEKLLRETKVGVVVNKFKTSSNPEVSNLVKKIIKFWKDEVKKAKSTSSASPPIATTATSQKSTANPPTNASTTTQQKKFVSQGPRNVKNDGVKTDLYENRTRNNVVGALYNGLCIDSEHPPHVLLRVAKELENELFTAEKFDTTKSTYTNKARSLASNLRQKNNPELRQRINNGDITPKEFINMDPKDMAPEHLKKQLEDIKKQNLFNAQGATQERAVTDRFTCGKCKEKKVSYYQLQTRSADEPLTTFCTCENCGNRWKFS